MTQPKVFVISGSDDDWGSELANALGRLGARAASLSAADAVAVMLRPTAANAPRFGLSLAERDRRPAEIRNALAQDIPVTPVLGGCGRIATARFELPDDLEDLSFRVGIALPSISAAPEIAAQLVAAALRTKAGSDPPAKPAAARSSILLKTRERLYTTLPLSMRGLRPAEFVFVSYRHDDTAHWARELAKSLSTILGPSRVFLDVGNDSPGLDFRGLIDAALADSSIVVVVIGAAYLAADADGGRRIDDKHDWVRAEVRAAIASGKPMRVVLVGSASMPTAADLPADIRALADATVAGAIRTGWEMNRIMARVLTGSEQGWLLGRGLERGSASGFADDMSTAWRIKAVRDGLGTLGWALEDPDLSRPQRLLHADHSGYRFEIDGENGIVVLAERTGKRWERRALFSITGSALGDAGVMKLERRLVEAAVDPAAFLDRTGRETLPAGKPEWPAGLDPLHYGIFRRDPLPMTIEAWNDARRHIRASGGLPQLAPPRMIGLEKGIHFRVGFMPDGQSIVAVTDGAVEVFDAATGSSVAARKQTKYGSWTALDVSAGGRVAIGSFDGRLTLLDRRLQTVADLALPRRWSHFVPLYFREGFPRAIRSLSWSSSEAYIAVATDSDVWILDVAAETFKRFEYPTRRRLSGEHHRARFAGDTDRVVVHAQAEVWTVDAPSADLIGTLEPAWRPDPEWKDREVADADWPRRLLGILNDAVPSPGADVIALAGSDGQIGFADMRSMRITRLCAWHEPTVNASNDVQAIAFHPRSDRLATVASDAYLIIADTESGQPVSYAFVGASLGSSSPSIAWAPDGKRIALVASIGDEALRVWTLEE